MGIGAEHKTKELSDWQRALVPSITDLLFVLLFFLLVALGSTVLLSDADIGWHIRTGEHILKTGSVPREDLFSYTMSGKRWYAWEWLFDWLLAVIHRMAGLNGVVVFAALIISLTYALLFRFILRRSMDLLLSLFIMLVAFLSSSVHWLARPHIASWLLTVIWFALLDAYQTRGKKYILAFLVLMILWTNLHGGFVFGIFLLALYALGNALTYMTVADKSVQQQAARRTIYLTLLLAACSLSTLLNPYGYQLHRHIFDYLLNPTTYQIPGEFKSPDFHMFPVRLFEWLLFLSLPLSALSLRTGHFIPVLLVVFSIHFSLQSVRHIPLAGLVIAPLAAVPLRRILDALKGQAEWRHGVRAVIQSISRFSSDLAGLEIKFIGHGWPTALVLVVAAVCLNKGQILGHTVLRAGFSPEKYPIAVSQFMRAHPLPGRVFNTYEWGGLLIYNLYPEFRVFVDSRSDFYPVDFLQRYEKVVRVDSAWKSILREAGIDWIITPSPSALASTLRETPEWKPVYDDGVAILFVKQ